MSTDRRPAEAGDGAVLRVRDLAVHAGGAPLVTDVDLRVDRGERVGLIGESGSGKSLTALAVMGLLPEGLRASGDVRLEGVGPNLLETDERTLSGVRGRRAAMVFQEPMTALNPTMRIGDQVAEAMTIHRLASDRRAARERAVQLLSDVRLPDPREAARAYPHQLSGGQRQRVVLAIALANDPALLVADEPTTALDVTVQAAVLDLIVSGVAARDAGLLFITHDLAVVATVCDRVAVMTGGRIVETGPVRDVLTDPRHPYTRRLLAASELAPREAADAPAPDADAPVVLEARDVTRRYRRGRTSLRRAAPPVEAVRGVSLSVRRGERVGIVGESGCGKSTLLRLIAGLDDPTTGTVELDGRTVSGRPARALRFVRERLQLVLQDPMSSLDPRMRVRDIVAEPLVAQGLGVPDGRVGRLLESVGLDPASASRFPHQFSGGQRQRISIARALAPNPGVLVADEAVSALDVSVRAQVLDLIGSLVDELDLTLVFVSHDLSVVRHVCDRVVVMNGGAVVEEGPTARVYEDPQHPYTRRLVASVPTISGALAGRDVAALVGEHGEGAS